MGHDSSSRDGYLIRSARLRQRPSTPNDTSWLHQLWTDPGVRRYLWDDEIIDEATVDALLEWSARSFVNGGYGVWIAEWLDTSEPIGFTALRPIEPAGPIELLFGFFPAWWGQGLAVEAGAALLAYGFTHLELPAILGDTDAPNVASARALEKLGMVREGEIVRNGLPALRFRAERTTWQGPTR